MMFCMKIKGLKDNIIILILFVTLITVFGYSQNTNQSKRNFIKIEPINEIKLKELLKDKECYKLLHFWGSWCPGQSIGIDLILRLSEKKIKKLNVIVVATDLYSISTQKAFSMLSRKYKMATPFFIFNTQKDLLSEEDVDSFTISKPLRVKKFIFQVDSNIKELSLPYTALIDTSGKLINSFYPLLLESKYKFQINKVNFKTLKRLYFKELKAFLKEELIKINK